MPKANKARIWLPIGIIPKGKPIEVQTVTGFTCRAVVPKGEKIRWPDVRVKVKRINAKRLKDSGAIFGDVRATAWREAI